jgi:hypothetical protein
MVSGKIRMLAVVPAYTYLLNKRECNTLVLLLLSKCYENENLQVLTVNALVITLVARIKGASAFPAQEVSVSLAYLSLRHTFFAPSCLCGFSPGKQERQKIVLAWKVIFLPQSRTDTKLSFTSRCTKRKNPLNDKVSHPEPSKLSVRTFFTPGRKR